MVFYTEFSLFSEEIDKHFQKCFFRHNTHNTTAFNDK